MLSGAEVDATMAYAQAEKAAATRKAYASDWRDFSRWCGARLAATLPAHPGIVASYLSDLAQQGCKASTIVRRAASIGYHHKLAGHEPPTGAEAVKIVLRGIRRTIGTARAGKAPATADVLMQMVALCPDNMIGRRDRALLALGLAGAFRRSELCALQVEDLVAVPGGLRVLIRWSRRPTRQGRGRRSRFPAATSCARPGRYRRGWLRGRSVPGRCSGRLPWAGRCRIGRWWTRAPRGS
jgi:site-specific recombinase XerD